MIKKRNGRKGPYVMNTTDEPFKVSSGPRLREMLKRYNKSKSGLGKGKTLVNREELMKIVHAILKKTADKLVENEGGVLLDGIGYFFVWAIPKRQGEISRRFVNGNELRYLYNHQTQGYVYTPLLLTNALKRNELLQPWSMDYTFSAVIKKKLAVNLKAGKKYKMYYSLIKALGTKSKNKKRRAKYIGKY